MKSIFAAAALCAATSTAIQLTTGEATKSEAGTTTKQTDTTADAAKTCKAVVLSGGGCKGAFEAGAIYELMNSGAPEDFEWDVVTGVSAGSINSLGISLWEKDQGVAMSEWLKATWHNLHSSDIYTEWDGSYAYRFFMHGSLFDNTPLKEFVSKIYAEKH